MVFALKEEMGLFKAMKNNNVAELGDPKLIANLAFLTDLTDHMNTPEQIIAEMIVV